MKPLNYQIVTDDQKLKEFIEWLPELKPSETFYLCLFARSKYTQGITHIRSDKAQLKRFTSNKERLFTKIKQLECPVGSYVQKDVIVPQEALALYITINPRCFVKANKNSVKKLLDLALQEYNGFHPYQEVMSEIQKAKSRSKFVTFDFDCAKNEFPQIKSGVAAVLNAHAYQFVETRGGFHLIVEPEKVSKILEKKWYNSIRAILNVFSSDTDNIGDIMLPVIGTYQGGFTPKFTVK